MPQLPQLFNFFFQVFPLGAPISVIISNPDLVVSNQYLCQKYVLQGVFLCKFNGACFLKNHIMHTSEQPYIGGKHGLFNFMCYVHL